MAHRSLSAAIVENPVQQCQARTKGKPSQSETKRHQATQMWRCELRAFCMPLRFDHCMPLRFDHRDGSGSHNRDTGLRAGDLLG